MVANIVPAKSYGQKKFPEMLANPRELTRARTISWIEESVVQENSTRTKVSSLERLNGLIDSAVRRFDDSKIATQVSIISGEVARYRRYLHTIDSRRRAAFIAGRRGQAATNGKPQLF